MAEIGNDRDKSKRERLKLYDLMKMWISYRNKWYKNPLMEFDIRDEHFILYADNYHHRLHIYSGKYEWVEDYSPEYVTARFSCGSRS